MPALLHQVLPNVGDTKSAAQYRITLLNKGYSFMQAIGSLGGASNAKRITIQRKVVTRQR